MNSILYAITKYKRLAIDFAFQYDEKLFLDNKENKLAKLFLDYIKIYKDKPTKRVLLDIHKDNGEICKLIEGFYSKENNYDEADYNFDLAKLKQEFSSCKITEITNYLNNINDQNDLSTTVKHIQKQINEVKTVNSSQQAYKRQTVKEHINEFTKDYIAKQKDENLGRGILTGYSYLDYINNGLRPSDLIIVAGETGSGKSLLMSNMAIQIWMQQNQLNTPKDQFKKGYNVAYFSLEMPYRDCFRRTLARLADVPNYSIRDTCLTKAEATSVKQAFSFIKNYPYVFDIIDVPRGFSVEQLELEFEKIKADYTPDVVFIDYMGLMEDIEEDSDDWLALGKLAGKIHEFARVYSVPVVTAVQLNRLAPAKNQTDAQTIGLHRIGRSSLMATHATLVIQIETRQDEETHDDFIYHIIKNRDGESRKKYSVWKNFKHSSITDKPFNPREDEGWSESEDISADIADILGLLDG